LEKSRTVVAAIRILAMVAIARRCLPGGDELST
jgi:hypothetical protein